MTDISTRLLAALDEAEQQARAAWPSPWEVGESSSFFGGSACVMMPLPFPDGAPAKTGLTSYVPLGRQDEGTIRHIARWDPGTVLQLVAFFRDLLDRHREYEDNLSDRPTSVRCFTDDEGWPCDDIQRAAEFWLGDTG